MIPLAPRIPHRLLEAIVRFDDRSQPIAETCRRVGAEAERLGLIRPSYQRIRVLVHEARRIRRGPTALDLWRIVTTPLRSTDDAIERLRELGVRPLVDRAEPP
ncbi:MAG TPA: hypothetical protein VFA66_01780 [Gaiellaceae bacterium]|nr:hypothetical protein [Gaiellaceae bacterium]